MSSLTFGAIFIIVLICFPCIIIIPTTVSYVSTKNYNKNVLLSFAMAWIWGIAGYCFVNPKSDPDLVRYLEILKNYDGKTLLESFNLAYDNLYSVDIFFHLVSKLENPQMLPAISVFIFYFILFYVFLDYKIKMNVSNKNFIIYILFSLGAISFPVIVNGIRWPIACMVFFLAFYREIVQNKKNVFTLLLYIIPIFMHFSMLVFVVLRLAVFIRNKKIAVIVTIFSGLIPNIFNLLSQILPLGSSNVIIGQFVYFINRGNMYFQWKDTDSGWAEIVSKSSYYKVESLYYIAITIMFFFIVYLHAKSEKNQEFSKDNVFVFYLIIITVTTFPMAGHTYIRFVIPMITCFCLYAFKFYRLHENDFLNLICNGIFAAFSLVGVYLNLHLLGSMINLKEYFSNIFVFGIFNLIL